MLKKRLKIYKIWKNSVMKHKKHKGGSPNNPEKVFVSLLFFYQRFIKCQICEFEK